MQWCPRRTRGETVWVQLRAIVLSVLMITSVLAVGGAGLVGGTDAVDRSVDSGDDTVSLASVDQSADCLIVDEGESVQDALDEAEPGDTVCVGDGVYDGDLEITTGDVTLTAAAGAEPVLEGDDFAGVTVSASGVTVSGLEVREFTRGISISGAHARVENNLLTGNEDGVYVDDGNGGNVTGNTITENDEHGILFSEFTTQENIAITDNTITKNGHHAVRIDDATGTVVEDNEIRNNAAVDASPALSLEDASDTVVTGNLVADNGQHGIDFRGSTDANITDNEVTNNSRGIHFTDVTSSEVRNNLVTETDGSGIWFRETSGLEIADNVLSENRVGLDAAGSDNTDLTVSDNDVSSERVDLRLNSVTDATVLDNTFATGVLLTGGVNPERAHFRHEFDGNTVGGAPLYYVTDVDDPAINPDAGQVIVANATNVDISGFEMSDVPAGIQVAYSEDVTITENAVADGDETLHGGIVVTESTAVVVADNDVSNQPFGIQIVGGSANVVENNVITQTRDLESDEAKGILLERDGRDHTVRGNTVTGLGEDGIHVRNGVEGALVESNTVEENARDGVHVRWNAHNTTVRDNTIVDNDGDGIFLERADETVVEHNQIRDNRRGIGTDRDVVDLTIEGNVIAGHSAQGIQLEPPGALTSGDAPSSVTITENEIEDNAREGISLEETHDVHVVNNSVVDNGMIDQWDVVRGGGVDATDATDTILENNAIVGNVDGVTASGETVDARSN